MSENSDAIVVIVSEETGNISVAVNGNLERNFTPESLRMKLSNELISADDDEAQKRAKRPIAKLRGRRKK